MSKGTWHRPRSVSRKTFEDNWDRIFKKKEPGEYERLVVKFGLTETATNPRAKRYKVTPGDN